MPVAKLEEESSIAICLQVLFPYLLAGMGMVMAGMVLDYVQVRAPIIWLTFQLLKLLFVTLHCPLVCVSNCQSSSTT